MPTTVTSSIGTSSRDYSTVTAWEAACPANLVTADQIWRGECYNDSEFDEQALLSGITTDSTRYLELTAAAGQSFQDHADVRTNPLRYDQAKGVALKSGVSDFTGPLRNECNFTRLSRFQVLARTGGGGGGTNYALQSAGVNRRIFIDDCIFQSHAAQVVSLRDYVIRNCAVISERAGSGAIHTNDFTALSDAHHCAFVNVNASAGGTAALNSGGGSAPPNFYNCAVFNFSTLFNVENRFNDFQYCATDRPSTDADGILGATTGSIFGLALAGQFEEETGASTCDLRLATGSDLEDAGNSGISGTPTTDISGVTRDASPDIGAWEFAAAVPPAARNLHVQRSNLRW
jgi:hypothetical protein